MHSKAQFHITDSNMIHCLKSSSQYVTISSGRAGGGGIDARGKIYMGNPTGVVEIHFQLEIAALVKVPLGQLYPSPRPFALPLTISKLSHYVTQQLSGVCVCVCVCVCRGPNDLHAHIH